jgi:peptidoglycan-associated lipoprotein
MKETVKAGVYVLTVTLLIAGCATRGNLQSDETRDGAPPGNEGGAAVIGVDEDCKPPCAFPRSALEDPKSPISQRLVFFDYDKSEIKPEYQQLLIDHGKYLASYPDTKVRLEGHTDERGSREYNLALGEARSKAVRRVLLLQGVPEENISVVSFGEELPLDVNHNETAWAQNRRVEIVYETH